MTSRYFETALERIGRIIARQYHIDVRFEGNLAYTDGNMIVLPSFENLTRELKQDLNGFLDHEVGHCRHTTFPEILKVINRFHKELLNATEDTRIEREMVKDYPGCSYNLDPMNERLQEKISEKWDELPAPIRIIMGSRSFMETGSARYDEDTKRYLDLVKDKSIELNNCVNTEEIREKTEEIVKLIMDEREKEKEEKNIDDDMGEGEEGDLRAGAGGGSPDFPGEEKKGKKFDKMMGEGPDSKNSEFDKHVTDAERMINTAIAEHLKAEEDEKIRHNDLCEKFNSAPHIPVTTKFDKIKDETGSGTSVEYGNLMRHVKPHVRPIQNALERALKVRENARWTPERERGRVDARNLGKLLTDPNFRKPFRDFTKEDVSNVAVELLIDMSGSMSGSKVTLAKESAIAMGEALAGIGIAFEVTGFHTEGSHEVSNFARGMKDLSRFNRTSEALHYHIFKSFDSPRMHGLCAVGAYGNNTDGEAVKWAGKRVAERHEKRKIMIVFSDGNPVAHGDRSIMNHDLKKAVADLNKIGVETVGVGIMSSAVDRFYPDHIVIHNLNELPSMVMKKLAGLLERKIVA